MAVMLLISTTRQQMVLDYMQKKALDTDEEKFNVRDTKNKTKSKKDKSAWIDQGIGVPLSRSTAQKYWAKEPKECNHPGEYLRCRANRYSQWWVCLTCGSRWERLQQDKAASSTSTVVPETPDARHLQAKTGTYPEHLPAPRSKPDQGNIQLAVDKRGRVSNVPTKETSSTGTTGYPKEHLTGARARSTSKDRQPEGLRALSRPKRTTVTEQTEIQELVQDESSWGHLTEMEDPNNPNLQQIEDSDF